MVLKLFADIIDALGQVAGGIKAIAKLPKAAQKSAYVGVNAMNPCLNRRDDGKARDVMQAQDWRDGIGGGAGLGIGTDWWGSRCLPNQR